MVTKIQVVLLFICVSQCLAQNQGGWNLKTYNGADHVSCTSPFDTQHYVWKHENAPAEEADNRTHYHYEYQFMDHIHYVTINYLHGMGSRGSDAGMLAFSPFNRTPASLPKSSFKFNLPEGATVEEQYHYEYTYAFHDHKHYVSGFDSEMLPWWENPAWFKTTEEDPESFEFNFEITKDQLKNKTFDVKVTAQKLFAHMTPEQLREETKQADATGTVRKEGPYVQYPIKSAAGYDFIKVPTPDKTKAGKVTGDHTTHHRYVRNSVNHKWYIPVDEQTTVSRQQDLESEQEVTTTHSASPTSDRTRVVVHYHINNHHHLHEHMVYYVENNWLKNKESSCPFNAPELPTVVPGHRQKGDHSNNTFMNFVHPENHPKDSQVHYFQVYGHTSRDHKQQLYRDGTVQSESGQRNAKFRGFFYDPVSSRKSSNHVHYNHIYVSHEHNHTVLLRGASPPGVVHLNSANNIDELGEVTKDLDLLLLNSRTFEADLVMEESSESSYGYVSLLVFCAAVAVGCLFLSKAKRWNNEDNGYRQINA